MIEDLGRKLGRKRSNPNRGTNPELAKTDWD